MDKNDYYTQRASFVRLWTSNAGALKEAAIAVWTAGNKELQADTGKIYNLQTLGGPSKLLMGLSLETLLKGLLVKRDPSLVSGGKLHKSLNTHKLENLCKIAGVVLEHEEDELNFVRRLTDSVEWASKYPVPLHPDNLVNSKNKSTNVMTGFDVDIDRFLSLYSKIERKYNL